MKRPPTNSTSKVKRSSKIAAPDDDETAGGNSVKRGSWAGGWASLRDLETVKTVIELGSATAAAARLGVSQPAISRALALMEQRSGRKLFARQGTAIVPTADATMLYEEIGAVFDALERVRGLQWGTHEPMDTLRIATTSTISHCFLSSLIARYVAKNPGARVTLEFLTTPQIFERVADRQVDLGIASSGVSPAGLKRIVFRRSKYVCAVPRNHRLASTAVIRPEDLQGVPLVTMLRRNESRVTTDHIFMKAGVQPLIAVETAAAASAITCVAEGAGVALINAFPVNLLNMDGVVLRPFEPELVYDTAFFSGADRVLSSTALRFIEYVRAAMPPSDEMSQAI